MFWGWDFVIEPLEWFEFVDRGIGWFLRWVLGGFWGGFLWFLVGKGDVFVVSGW